MKSHLRLSLVLTTLVLGSFAAWLVLQRPEAATQPVHPLGVAIAPTPLPAQAWQPGPAAGKPVAIDTQSFSESSARLIAAAEAGRPVRIRLGDGAESSWVLRPMTVTTKDFKVSTGSNSVAPVSFRVYEGFRQGVTGIEARKAFIAVVDSAVSAVVLTDDGVMHVQPNESGSGWTVLMEKPLTGPGAVCVHEKDGVCANHGGTDLVVWNDGGSVNKGPVSIDVEPASAASDGRNPLDGTLTLTADPIPYGPLYDASLQTILALLVDESIGSPTQAAINSNTANYLSLAASLHAMYENQLGMKYLVQELILIGTGSDFNTPALKVAGSANYAELGYLYTWLSVHRPRATYLWTVASKIGTVTGANGVAYIGTAGSESGINVNNGVTIGVVGHETGHNLGTNHTAGGIMNPSTNGSRDFFTTVQNATPQRTAAKDIWTTMSQPSRLYGSASLRNAGEIPFANDDMAVTLAGTPVVLNVLANDATTVPLGATNTLRVVEVGPVSPAGAGTLSFSESQVSFAPAAGFAGSAYFTYTIQGSVGNGGAGWLHKGDAAVVVHDPDANAPSVTASRGAASGYHNNARAGVAWSAPVARPLRWEIERSANGSPFERVALVDGRNRNWIDLSIFLAASVQYRVRAHNGQVPTGPWGLSSTLASVGTTKLWDGFEAGNLNQWTVWNNSPTSLAANDTTTLPYNVSVTTGSAQLQTTGAAPRLGLLVSNQTYNLSQTGTLSLAADLAINAVADARRLVAWIDDGGTVIWISIERDGSSARKVRLFAADSLVDFFNRVDDAYSAGGQLYQNAYAGNAGTAVSHRATLTVSTSGVGMTVFAAAGSGASHASTLGLIPHGLANFTGVGRFAVGGYASPTGSNVVTFRVDNVSLSSEPVPLKYLPALIDDTLTVPRGTTAEFIPATNDVGLVGPLSQGTIPAGLIVASFSGDSGTLSVHAATTANLGTSTFQVSHKTSGYANSSDGLTGYSTVYVEVTDNAPAAATDEFTLRQGDGPLRFNPLLNDTAVGVHNLAQVKPRLTSTTTGTSDGNSYRLVSATLLTPALGSIILEQFPAVLNGVIVQSFTGQITFTPASASTTGTAQIQYTLEDALGNQVTGLTLIKIVPAGYPRFLSHPLAASVAASQPIQLSVTAQGTGTLSYQWYLNDSPINGATTSTYSVASATLANKGTYTVEVSNTAGTAKSLAADVNVEGVSFASWIAQFNAQIPADQRGLLDDWDKDGIVNLIEFALGLNPAIASTAGLPAPSTVTVGNETYLQLTYRQRKGGTGTVGVNYIADGVTYAVQTSDTLAAADWKTLDAGNQPLVEQVGTAVDNSDGTETVVVRLKAPISASAHQFLRLKISQ